MGLVAHLASLKSSVPFVHFFDGTSLGDRWSRVLSQGIMCFLIKDFGSSNFRHLNLCVRLLFLVFNRFWSPVLKPAIPGFQSF